MVPNHGPLRVEVARLEIQVPPVERAELAGPHRRRQRDHPVRLQRIVLDCLEERPRLLGPEGGRLPEGHARRIDYFEWVPRQQLPADREDEGSVEAHVEMMDPLSRDRLELLAVEGLDGARSEFVEPDVAEGGDRVALDQRAVG